MSGSGKGLLGLWLYRMGEEEWKLKDSGTEHKVFLLVNQICFNLLLPHLFILLLEVKKQDRDQKVNTMIFSLKNQPGGLARALKVFQVRS